MNKQEAAEFLGVSVRALERYVQQGRVGGHYEKGKTRSTLVFDKAELEAFKAELEQKSYRPAVESSNPDNSATALARLSPSSSDPSEVKEVLRGRIPPQTLRADNDDFSAILEALLKRQSNNRSTPAYHNRYS